MTTRHSLRSAEIRSLALAGMFLALGYLLPFLTGQLQSFGNMLLPMHLPVLLCGAICGRKYGLAVGAILPITRALFFGMPPIYPVALAMSFELATYGTVIGLVLLRFGRRSVASLYTSLIIAMLSGRAVWGLTRFFLACIDIPGLAKTSFPFSAFLSGAFLEAIPGILLQLILIPSIILALERAHLIPIKEREK